VFAKRRVGCRNLTGRRQQQCERVLGSAVDVGGGRVDHQHAAGRCRVDVHVVEADASTRDDLQLGACGQDFGVDRRGRPY